ARGRVPGRATRRRALRRAGLRVEPVHPRSRGQHRRAQELCVSATDLLLQERGALCDTLVSVGPEAPTLCTGWLTADLAAHLLAREKRPDAGPGIIVPGPFARHTQRVMEKYKAKGYDPMITELRAGPPRLFRVGPMAAANVVENWIHHEDVRRP